MKRRQTVVCGILAAVLALAFTACPGPNQMEPGTGSVAGTVVFTEGEGGIAITLTLEAVAGRFSLDYVLGDETGGSVPFRFDDVPPGIHALYASWQSTPESEPLRGFVRNVEVRAGIEYPLGNIIINLGCACGTIPDACGCASGNVSCTCTHGNVPGCACDLDGLGCGCAPGNVSCTCTHGNIPGCACDPDDPGCDCTPGNGSGCGCGTIPDACGCTRGNIPGCACDPDDHGCDCTPGNGPGCDCGTIPDACGCTHGNVPGCGCGTIPDACGCTHGNVPGCDCGTIPDACGCTQPVAAITIVSNGVGVTSLGLTSRQYYRVLYAECPGGNPLSNLLWFSTNPGVVSVQRPAGRSMLESGETVLITMSDGAVIGDTAIIRATSMGGVGGNLVEAALLVTILEETETRFVRIQGGTFEMGCVTCCWDAGPIRSVTVSDFYMGNFQVRQGEWYDVMGTRPSHFHGGAGVNWRYLPVESVSWYDAIVFSNRLSIQRGLSPAYSINGSTNPDDWGSVPTWDNSDAFAIWDAVVVVPGSTGYRLPTEAQWEFAARGGIVCQGNFAFSGSDTAADVAWYGGNSGNRTHEVGMKQPNALGLYDMSGNVWEWIWDWFDWGGYPDHPETDPTGAPSGFMRVARGGNWQNPADLLLSTRRLFESPDLRAETIGFRLVRP